MIKTNQKAFIRLEVLIDAIVICISYYGSYFIQFGIKDSETQLSETAYLLPMIPTVICYLLLNYLFHLYQPMRVTGRRNEAFNVLKVNLLGALLFMAALYVVSTTYILTWMFSRMMILYFFLINTFLTILWRNLIRMFLMSIRKGGFNQKHIIIVGYSRAAENYLQRVLTHPQWGYHVYGILDDTSPAGTDYEGVKVIGKISELSALLATNEFDEIIVTLSIKEYAKLEAIVNCCEKSGVHTKFVPDYNNIFPTRPYTEDLLGVPVINIRHVPLTEGYNRVIKRTMDIVGSAICIVVFSPVMIGTAIAIKVSSPGPLIFKQERVGLHNRTFNMFKFRSMTVQKKSEEVAKWTTKNDARVTSVGKFIRKTSIDELPQLFNVLKGDMSLIGPRPERPYFVEKFREEIPRYMIKHQVRPGMTGWAQVNGYRGDTSIEKRIECDLYYIENWTVGLDIKILILTVFKGFVNKNAY